MDPPPLACRRGGGAGPGVDRAGGDTARVGVEKPLRVGEEKPLRVGEGYPLRVGDGNPVRTGEVGGEVIGTSSRLGRFWSPSIRVANSRT